MYAEVIWYGSIVVIFLIYLNLSYIYSFNLRKNVAHTPVDSYPFLASAIEIIESSPWLIKKPWEGWIYTFLLYKKTTSIWIIWREHSIDSKWSKKRAAIFQCQLGLHRPPHFKLFIPRTVFILLLHRPAVTSCSSPCSSPITQPMASNLGPADLICTYCKKKHQKPMNCRLDHSTHL